MRQIYSPLDGFRSPFGRLMGSTAPFTPAVLFGASEPGVWLDPSDVANLAWRRNLLTFTEQFDTASWAKDSCTVPSTQHLAPDGTTTADRIVSANATAVTGVGQSLASAISASAVYTASYYVQANGARYIQVLWSGSLSTNFANFDLQNPTAPTGGTYTAATISAAANGFYRITITSTLAAASGGSFLWLLDSGTAGRGSSFTGNGTSGIFIWGAQLELGSVATDYQRISDVNTEVIERFPSATLYQDTAGTTPVTTPGQTVALALDKSKGLVLGSELVTNGDFSTGDGPIVGWTSEGNVTRKEIVNGKARLTSSSAAGYLTYQRYTSMAGKRAVRITVSGTTNTGGSVTFALGDASAWNNQTFTVNGSIDRIVYLSFTPSTFLQISLVPVVDAANVNYAEFDNISVKELPGFHATQATLASRPTYGIVPLGGRRNLLTRTEEFSNADWLKSTTPAVTLTNQGGGVWRLQAPAGEWLLYQLRPASGTHTIAFDVKSNGAGLDGFRFMLQGAYVGGNRTATSDWVRYSTSNVNAGSGAVGIVAQSTLTAVDILIRFPQLEIASSATAYQRVGSAFDVTEAGVASLSYLSFDGVDDFMVTPTITPGIDKAQVFAGVRKLSDAATGGELVSTLNAASSNNGVIVMTAPGNAPSSYDFASKGTSFGSAVLGVNSFPAPTTNVLTGLGDIAGDRATLRINGTQAVQSTDDQGTGNYLAYPLYIGRRAGVSISLNAQLFSLIVRFGTNLDAGTITSTETWVNGKTGAYA